MAEIEDKMRELNFMSEPDTGYEKKYQVFLSSTYVDLVSVRSKILKSLLELDCIPAAMENFPAADDEQFELIKQVIDHCDYYIVVVAGKYGSPHPSGLSYTHMEYRYARSIGVPCIAFLHKNPQKLPAEDTESSPSAQKNLWEFRSELEKNHCKYWDNEYELDGLVSRSLYHIIKKRPRPGWVRRTAQSKIDSHTNTEYIEEVLELFVQFMIASKPSVYYRVLVAIADLDKGIRVTVCGANIRNDPDAHLGVPINFGVSGAAFTNEHREVGDISPNDEEIKSGRTWREVRSVLSVPIRTAYGKVYGTLNIDGTKCADESGFLDRPIQDAIDRLAQLIGPRLQHHSKVGR